MRYIIVGAEPFVYGAYCFCEQHSPKGKGKDAQKYENNNNNQNNSLNIRFMMLHSVRLGCKIKQLLTIGMSERSMEIRDYNETFRDETRKCWLMARQ
jgi:hypothetical protein